MGKTFRLARLGSGSTGGLARRPEFFLCRRSSLVALPASAVCGPMLGLAFPWLGPWCRFLCLGSSWALAPLLWPWLAFAWLGFGCPGSIFGLPSSERPGLGWASDGLCSPSFGPVALAWAGLGFWMPWGAVASAPSSIGYCFFLRHPFFFLRDRVSKFLE